MGVCARGTGGGQVMAVVAVVAGVAGGAHVRRTRGERLCLDAAQAEAEATGVRRRGRRYAHLRDAKKRVSGLMS